MTLEFWTTFASVGTFVVIAATAVAALVQLRHMRAANQVAAFQTLMEMYEGPALRDAFHFVRSELPTRLQDPEFRRELRSGELDRTKHPELQICNLFDTWGNYYRHGAIDREAFMEIMAEVVSDFWDLLAPAIAIMAQSRSGVNVGFENFEFLTLQAREWIARHPQGTFPKRYRRIEMVDPWKEIDSAVGPSEAGGGI